MFWWLALAFNGHAVPPALDRILMFSQSEMSSIGDKLLNIFMFPLQYVDSV